MDKGDTLTIDVSIQAVAPLYRFGRVGKQVDDMILDLISGDADDGSGKVQDLAEY